MNKGFTLVELLAVIVILAVLALIATPVVLSIIDDTKESAMLRSAEMYLSGVENAVMRENMNSGGNFRPNECIITNGNMICGSTSVEVEVDGEVPSTGTIIFENGKITQITLNYESGTIVKDSSGSLVYAGSDLGLTYTSLGNYEHKASDDTIEFHDTESGTCSKCGQTVLAPGLYDDDWNMTKSWEELLTTDINYSDANLNTYTTKIINVDENGRLWTLEDVKNGGFGLGSSYLVGNMVLSKDVKTIGTYVFSNSTNLKSIRIPRTVTQMQTWAIYNSSSISNIYYDGTLEEWNKISFGSEWFWKSTDIIVNCIDNKTVTITMD